MDPGTAMVMAGFLIAGLIFGLFVYLLPGIVGSKRRVHNRGLLWFCTLTLGWSAIGWLVCMIWAVVGRAEVEDWRWREIERKMTPQGTSTLSRKEPTFS
jgi:hypothetical protein